MLCCWSNRPGTATRAWQYQPPARRRERRCRSWWPCREQGIATVFWNKEDPPHFEDFLDTARLFDQVFTTDVTLLPRYREELGHERVAVLPFAAQSAVHNPIRPKHGHQERDVAFAGMYFAHKFPERREQMDTAGRGAGCLRPHGPRAGDLLPLPRR